MAHRNTENTSSFLSPFRQKTFIVILPNDVMSFFVIAKHDYTAISFRNIFIAPCVQIQNSVIIEHII